MAGQPRKRQKRAVYDSEDDDDEYIDEPTRPNSQNESAFSTASRGTQKTKQAPGRSSRSSQRTINQLSVSRQPTLPSTSTSTSILTRPDPAPSPRKTRSKPAGSPKKGGRKASSESPSKSLHSFFRPATEEERWDRVKKEKITQTGKENKRLKIPKDGGLFKRKVEVLDNEVLEDIIEDDDSDEMIFSQQLRPSGSSQRTSSNYHGHLALDRRKDIDPVEYIKNHGAGVKKPAPSKPLKRFLLPFDETAGTAGARNLSPSPQPTATVTTRRPWADEFAPANLDELAVHKKKVTDIENWLTDVFSGRSRRVSTKCLLI